MNKRTFGAVLENLLYISKQKKSSLANYLGYDVSYINKWVNSKKFPSSKRAKEICSDISEFIVNSLEEDTRIHLVEYFELESNNETFLLEYIKDLLINVYYENSYY